MSVAKGRLNWGVFFIVLGAVPLAYHQGVVSQSQIGDAWRLWPLIVVGIGVGFILSRTPAYFVGGMVVAATLGLMLGSLFAVGPSLGCGHHIGTASSVSQSGVFDGPASVELNLQCGNADITTSSDAEWHVDATNATGRTADISSSANSVKVETEKSGADWFSGGDDTWRIALPQQSQLDLRANIDLGEATYDLNGAILTSATFNMNLGTLHVDLSGAHVGSLTVSTSLASTYVQLDGSSDLTASIKTSLGSFKLCVPSELGLQIKSTDSLSSTDLGHFGMYRTGDQWETPNFGSAAHRAILTIDTSLGSFELQSSGGCK
jgi:hypothetical protein